MNKIGGDILYEIITKQNGKMVKGGRIVLAKQSLAYRTFDIRKKDLVSSLLLFWPIITIVGNTSEKMMVSVQKSLSGVIDTYTIEIKELST